MEDFQNASTNFNAPSLDRLLDLNEPAKHMGSTIFISY